MFLSHKSHLKTFIFFIIIGLLSCNYDSITPSTQVTCSTKVTYEANVKPILSKSCAYIGCHLPRFSNGDYTNFAAIQNHLQNGKFERWVIKDRSMPPSYATEGPTNLTEEEINIIKCWKENNYVEK